MTDQNPEQIKKSYYRIKTSTVNHMKDLLSEIKGEKHIELEFKIKELEEELKELRNTKKYGLVWDQEKEPEQVVLDCQKKLPILKEVKERKIINNDSGDSNILIEGDNYHSLQVLNYTHKEAIDVIYIDPPYNTGNKDFIYNDKYIDKEDTYRHSKWLNFMEKRLRLAQDLLKEDGVIFISIDDNEQAQLKLLCDEIFKEENFIIKISRIQSRGKNNGNHFNSENDYVFVYGKNKEKLFINTIKTELDLKKYKLKDKIGNYKRRPLEMQGTDVHLGNRKLLGYSVYFNEKSSVLKILYDYDIDKEEVYEKESIDLIKKGYVCFRPRKSKKGFGIWRWNSETFLNKISEIDFDIKNKRIYLKDRFKNSINLLPTNNLEFLNTLGTTELQGIFGDKPFDYPKPSKLIKWLIDRNINKNSTILDFMAGSGTTGHAVLDLNKEDGGNRKFILCTNNENNICEEVTYERIKRMSNGYTNSKGKEIEGLGGNLRYYKTDFVEIESLQTITDDKKMELTFNAGELLAIKEGIYNEREDKELNKYGQVFENKKDIVAVYFKESARSIYEMEEKLAEIQKEKGGKVIWYIYGNPYEKESFEKIKNLELKDIPDPILKVYREINRV